MKIIKQTFLSDYLELTKPRILSLVLVTTALGFYLGKKGQVGFFPLFFTILGTALVCAGASALNHYLERDADSLMTRTKNRPIPRGAVSPQNAMLFGIVLTLFGIVLLFFRANLLTAFLALLTSFLYVLVYTPMKKISWLNTTIGAIPGAIPPMGGWAAATGDLSFGAWVLFLILFLWQHPHFFAIAWMCKEDYKKAGFKMLPVLEPDGRSTFRQIIFFLLLLIPVALLPVWAGMVGKVYFFGTLMLSTFFLWAGITMVSSKSHSAAKSLLQASVIYLPLLLVLIVIDIRF